MDDAPRGKLAAGDPAIVPLEDWNRVRAEMLRLLGLGAAAPLAWSWEGGRRSLRDTTPVGMWATLAGAGPTYTATEQVRDPATPAWVTGPRSLTDVVEVNGGTGLAGTVQFVEPSTSPGEWLFQGVKLGGTPSCGTITFTVRGCGTLLLAGATVTVHDGGTTASPVLGTGTTNSSGVYVQPIASAKNYAYTVAASRFNSLSGTTGVVPCTGSSNTNVSPNFTTVTSGTQFCTQGCALPLANVLHLNTPPGLITLTRNANGDWVGNGTFGCGTIVATVFSGITTSGGTAFHINASGLLSGQAPATATCPTVAAPGSLAVTYTTPTTTACWAAGSTLTLTE